MRRFLGYVLCCWLLLIVPAGCAPHAAQPPAPPPYRPQDIVHEPPTPDLLPRPRSARAFRLAVHTLLLDPQAAELAAQAGFDSVVQVFPWRDINPRPTYYHWWLADGMLRVAQEHDLDLVVRLDMPPYWAQRADPDGLPFELPAYLDFVAAVAARYRGHMSAYIVWNEPNLAVEWGGWVADPADYADVLCRAHARIRAADPGALVIAAGLAPTNEFSERAMDDREFLRLLLREDVSGCFDVLAAHDYGYGLPPDDAYGDHAGLNLARLLDLRAILDEAGASQPVWITELGYTLQSQFHPSVSPEEQARYLEGAFERVRREWPWVEMFTVWNLSFTGDAEMQGFSIIEADLTPRPAFEVISAMRRSLEAESSP